MRMALLELRNLETYYGPVAAIRGVSLDVEEGSIVTLLGANGAGKTTILRTVSGAVDPQKGSIAFAGDMIARMEPDRVVRRGIAHAPEGREVFPDLTVKQNLMMGAFTRDDRDGIAADIEMVYGYFPVLRERADLAASQLSGGQQQMLVIGRALMARPKLLLLDEPSLGLSPLLVKEIFAIIRRINTEQKVSILLVEQNAHMALGVAHYGYVLELGRIVMEAEARKLAESDDVREFYLGQRDAAARGGRRWRRKKQWR
jgi:branched-chain amino acid transport system ATP-binding protein